MSNLNSTIDIKGLRDIAPPFGVHLSGIYKKSHAYVTLKDRLPVILTGVIDKLSRDKANIVQKFGGDSTEEIKRVIGDLSQLRSELMTNKPLTPLKLSDSKEDADANVWNDYLKTRQEIEGPALTWFNTVWLLSECYMYRRINQAFVLTQSLKTYDPFEDQKQNAFVKSLNSVKLLARHTMDLLRRTDNVSTAERKHELIKLLKLNLWGNRCDLSLSGGAESNAVGNPVELLDSYESDLLIDDSKIVWDILSKPNPPNGTKIIDIVLDNAGYELFTDLCLSSFLIAHNIVDKVRFHGKRIPWFVSDVNLHDFDWIIASMSNSEDTDLKALGNVCEQNLRNNKWTFEVESFWTEPYDFGQMKEKAPGLYSKLSESVLVVFKGDLNYRKLMADFNWEHTTSLEKVLSEGGFQPTSLVSLRTIKADVCVGLKEEKVKELSEKDKDWMITGQYGLINAVSVDSCVCANSH
ncbi:damage-control phosphatase ARMT1-like [Venturia canescens]|uniref:damage-control phosphatase ARMT1-like n=1 Tax=Venturia canescens TaxID=32260 RepID=UPI001C9D0500|nr:damage-control phosphatase ARMT1-like [Venturia canescens]